MVRWSPNPRLLLLPQGMPRIETYQAAGGLSNMDCLGRKYLWTIFMLFLGWVLEEPSQTIHPLNESGLRSQRFSTTPPENQIRNQMIQMTTPYFVPPPSNSGNEGLLRDSLLKMVHNPGGIPGILWGEPQPKLHLFPSTLRLLDLVPGGGGVCQGVNGQHLSLDETKQKNLTTEKCWL